MKRIVSLLLAVIMLLSLCTFVATADDGTDPADWNGNWPDDGSVIKGVEGRSYYKDRVMFANADNIIGDRQTVAAGTKVVMLGADGALDGSGVRQIKYNGNTWIFGYAVKVEGVGDQTVTAKVSAKANCAQYDAAAAADQTASDLTRTLPGDGVYTLLVNAYMGNTTLRYVQAIKEFSVSFDRDVSVTVLAQLEGVSIGIRSGNIRPNGGGEDAWTSDVTVTYHDEDGAVEGEALFFRPTKGIVMGTENKSFPEAIQVPELKTLESREDEENIYAFLGWSTEQGAKTPNVTHAIGTMDVYPVFKTYNKADLEKYATVVFKDAYGNVLTSDDEVEKGTAPVYTGDTPLKGSTDDLSFTFAGWSIDGQNVVDLETYTVTGNVTFVPLYREDVINKASLVLSADSVMMGDTVTVGLKLNRNDLTTDVLAGTKETIVSGTAVIAYSDALLTVQNGIDGVVTVPFTAVEQDGTTNAEITFTASANAAGTSALTLKSVTVSSESVKEKEIVTDSAKVTVAGQQTGAYYGEGEAVKIYRADEGATPNQQKLWSGYVDLRDENGKTVDGLTLVYRVDGVKTPIIADCFYIVSDCDGQSTYPSIFSGNWLKKPAQQLSFEEDGYYYRYINYSDNQGLHFAALKEFYIFNANDQRGRVNTNENATFTLLAIVANNLTPTVNFYTEDKTLIASQTCAYTNFKGWSSKKEGDNADGALVGAAEIFEMTGAELPTKESDIAKVTYEFDGWVDAEGNPVDAVYMNCDVYPTFKTVDNRSRYTVEFVNADEAKTVLQSSEVPEDVLPEYTGETPKLPSTATKSYVFKGWDKEIVKTPVTDKQDGALIEEKIVYTATYEEVERRYDVTYYDEDGETKLGEVLNIVRGQAANFETVPTKDADVQNTYTFEKWVAMDGSDVDLTRVEADLSVKAKYIATLNKYTVTFMSEDKSEQIATSTVDYGTAAQAPEVTKDPEPEKYTAYEFDAWVDAEGNVVDLTNITGDVTVYATFKDVLVHEFTDLNESAWYMPSVKYALQNGLMSGMNNTTFAPDATMTRAQFATVLYRMEGEPDVSKMDDPELIDYNSDAWWADAFKWANNVGIINGSNINGVDMLDPDGTVTRLQIATMLYRYADNVFKANDGSVGIDMSELNKIPPTSLADFQDKNAINYSTKEARWAYNHEYITGMTKVEGEKPYFAPSDGASRAQVITILMRFLEDTANHKPKA